MTPSGTEQVVIRPVRKEVWRPFYAYGVLACVVVLAGLVAIATDASVPGGVVLFVCSILVVLAGARTLIWRLLPGRVTVSHDDSGLIVRRGRRVLRRYPWAGIRDVLLSRGDRWPEWDRWALFAHLSVLREGAAGPSIESSPGFLLVRPTDVEQAERALNAVVDRYIGGPAGE